VFFCRIAPGRLPLGESSRYDPFRFTEQHWNIFPDVEPVADEERYHHEVSGLCHVIAGRDRRFIIKENRMDGSIEIPGTNAPGMMVYNGSRVGITPGAMAGDKKSDVFGYRRSRERKSLHDLAGAREQYLGHAFMISDGIAKERKLDSTPLHARQFPLLSLKS